jgi:hypothetical protein
MRLLANGHISHNMVMIIGSESFNFWNRFNKPAAATKTKQWYVREPSINQPSTSLQRTIYQIAIKSINHPQAPVNQAVLQLPSVLPDKWKYMIIVITNTFTWFICNNIYSVFTVVGYTLYLYCGIIEMYDKDKCFSHLYIIITCCSTDRVHTCM